MWSILQDCKIDFVLLGRIHFQGNSYVDEYLKKKLDVYLVVINWKSKQGSESMQAAYLIKYD